ncbi:hypothetical protein SLS53_000465 [Cytospora paraplurivora]|uniref:GTP cyclohydrolase N-terminal domain-containing protein n=1 Tax=Cytospora paraplurivora TaxID=2898453 RepID=A0AAN9YLQ6_9PEZI
MASDGVTPSLSLEDVMGQLKAIQQKQDELLSVVDSLSHVGTSPPSLTGLRPSPPSLPRQQSEKEIEETAIASAAALAVKSTETPPLRPADPAGTPLDGAASPVSGSGFTSRIVLTTYPKQIGIKPFPMNWGAPEPLERGPIVVSRYSTTIRRRNAIGAHGGSYSIYYALALASKQLKADHRPDFTNTEPAVTIGPFPQWGDKKKIVAMDPWGHLSPWLFKDTIEREDGVFLSWKIAIPDGKICLNSSGELAVTKFAVEPVWYLPGVAERFGIVIFGIEEAVKEAQNGGTGVVIYFRKEGRALGEVTKCSTASSLTHILTMATVVYNARKRGEDRASDYFKRTENVAGVKDMRFQALMPDILHWLGITKIDRMLSMSNMKHDAIVDQGIPIHERVELPESLIPADSRVEIDAKITAGYFTSGHRMTEDELKAVQGRMWEE